MKQLMGVIFALILLGTPVVSIAQGGITETIPSCTSADMVAMADLLPEYVNRYAELSTRLQTAEVTDLDELLDSAHDLQVLWWAEGVPQMPRCALSIEATGKIGQLVDEMLISLLLLDANHLDLVEIHSQVIAEIGVELQQLGALIESSGPAISSNTDSSPMTISVGTTDLEIERFEFLDSIRGQRPENGVFVVLYATLHNNASSSTCYFARDFRLILDGQEYRPDGGLMSRLQDEIQPFRDYIGPLLGQCVDKQTNAPTFAVFDTAINVQQAIISFQDHTQEISVAWPN